jgi:hypothetical protein
LHGQYLNEVLPGPTVRLVTASDDPNRPLFNFDHAVDFTINIPWSLVNNQTQGAMVQCEQMMTKKKKKKKEDGRKEGRKGRINLCLACE